MYLLSVLPEYIRKLEVYWCFREEEGRRRVKEGNIEWGKEKSVI